MATKLLPIRTILQYALDHDLTSQLNVSIIGTTVSKQRLMKNLRIIIIVLTIPKLFKIEFGSLIITMGMCAGSVEHYQNNTNEMKKEKEEKIKLKKRKSE